MGWGSLARELPLFARGRLDQVSVREERVSEQVAAVLARIEPAAAQALLTRLARRAGIQDWQAPEGLTLRCEVVRPRPGAHRRHRRLDLAWLLGERLHVAIEAKVNQVSWVLGGQERDKFKSYAEMIVRETPLGGCLLALTPYALPPAELAPAKAIVSAGGVRWDSFCDVLGEVAADGHALDHQQRTRWPVAAALLPELAHLLGPDGLGLHFEFREVDMTSLSAYSAGLDTLLKVQDALDTLGTRLGAELTALGLERDKRSEWDNPTFRLRSPLWVFEPDEPRACADGLIVGVSLHLDVLRILCFLGFSGERHSEASARALAAAGLPLAWWGSEEERPRLDVPPEDWLGLVEDAGDYDWWGIARVRPLAEVLPHGIATDAPLAVAHWVAEELRRVNPVLTQADVWPIIAGWPAAWRAAQLRGHPEFGDCATCPAGRGPESPCTDGQELGWGPIACQAHLVRRFIDDDEALRLKLPAASGVWKGAPKSTGLYLRSGKLHCCGEKLAELGKKQSLSCPTCGKKHLRATILGVTRS